MTTLDEITINGSANTASSLLDLHAVAMPEVKPTVAAGQDHADGQAGRAPEGAELPEWMNGPCPSWCVMSRFHTDSTPYLAREHMGNSSVVWLTMEDHTEEGKCSPAPIDVTMFQHYRDVEPHLSFDIAYDDIPNLTMREGAELAAALAALAATAEDAPGKTTGKAAAGRPYWLSGPCPPWCTAAHSDADAPEDRAHVGEWRQVTLTMEGPRADAQPQRIGVRLEQGWREVGARVVMASGGRHLNLALSEARELSCDLDAHLASAR